MAKTSSNLLAKGSSDLKRKLSKADSADEFVKLVGDAGIQADKKDISHEMRTIAAAELQKHGFPEWAINSLFLGEAVCW